MIESQASILLPVIAEVFGSKGITSERGGKTEANDIEDSVEILKSSLYASPTTFAAN